MRNKKDRYLKYSFKNTLLYYGVTVTTEEWLDKCWYLRIITSPIFILQLLICILAGIVIDSIYFGFK